MGFMVRSIKLCLEKQEGFTLRLRVPRHATLSVIGGTVACNMRRVSYSISAQLGAIYRPTRFHGVPPECNGGTDACC